MTTITERVAAGAAFLDQADPEWWRADVERAIGLDTLDLGSGSRCILGQRCPVDVYSASELGDTRYAALAKRWSGSIFDDPADKWAQARGFQAGNPASEGELRSEPEYDALTAEWARVIRERRSA